MLSCLVLGPSHADDPVAEAIQLTKQTSPAQASELETLVRSSEVAKKFLATRDGRHAEPLKGFHQRAFMAHCALENTAWSMTRCKVEYPELCKEGELFGTVRDENGVHWTIHCFNGELAIGRYFEKSGEFSADQDPFKLPVDSSWCDYDTLLDPRGDTLLIRYRPKQSAFDKFRNIVTEHLLVKQGKLTLLKRVTEEYPIEKQ